MAGNKGKTNKTKRSGKSMEKEIETADFATHETTSKDKGKSKKADNLQGSNKRRKIQDDMEETRETQAEFLEGDQLMTMTVTGQNLNDDDQDSEDEAISFKLPQQSNNNAKQLEEGEIEDASYTNDSNQASFGAHIEVARGNVPVAKTNRADPKIAESKSTLDGQGHSSMINQNMIAVTDLKEQVNKMQDMINNSGILETAELIKKHFGNSSKDQGIDKNLPNNVNERNQFKLSDNEAMSEITVYQNAVENLIEKRISTSSEDETPNNSKNNEEVIEEMGVGTEMMIDSLISDQRREVEKRSTEGEKGKRGGERRIVNDNPVPSTSRNRGKDDVTPEEKG